MTAFVQASKYLTPAERAKADAEAAAADAARRAAAADSSRTRALQQVRPTCLLLLQSCQFQGASPAQQPEPAQG
jgi:hypothetical protein